MRKRKIFQTTLLFGLTGFFYSSALAGGFQVFERSSSGLGRAYSGEAAIGDDPSIVAVNPAGMALIAKREITSSAIVAAPKINLNVESAKIETQVNLPVLGQVKTSAALQGSQAGDFVGTQVIPSLFYVQPVGTKWRFGLAAYSNFGIKSDFDDQFIGSMATGSTSIITANVGANVSYRPLKWLSVGVGLNFVGATLNIVRTIPDIAALTDEIIDQSIQSLGLDLGIGNQPGDTLSGGKAVIDGRGFGFQFNFGVLLQLTRSTRIGLAYRPSMEILLDGNVAFEECSQSNVQLLGAMTEICGSPFGSRVPLRLPAIAEGSIYQRLNPRWALHADLVFTQWSVMDQMNVYKVQDNQLTLFQGQKLGYSNTFRYSLGSTYQVQRNHTIRFGIAYDQSPSNQQFRQIPDVDTDRKILSVGYRYDWSERFSVDFGYSHYIFDSFVIKNSTELMSQDLGSGISVNAEAPIEASGSSSIDFFAMQMNWSF